MTFLLLNFIDSGNTYQEFNSYDIVPKKGQNDPFRLLFSDDEDSLKNIFLENSPREINFKFDDILFNNCSYKDPDFPPKTKVYLDVDDLKIMTYHPIILEGAKKKFKKYGMIKLKPFYLFGFYSEEYSYSQFMIVCRISKNLEHFIKNLFVDYDNNILQEILENECNAKYYGDTTGCSRDISDTTFQCFSCKAKVCKTCYKNSFKNIVACDKCQCTVFKKV